MINNDERKERSGDMKKTLIRTVSLVMGAIICVFCLASCSKKPYDYDLKEYITVPDDLAEITVTDAEILERVALQIQTVLENKATYSNVTVRGAMPGDTLKLTVECFKTDEKKTPIPELSDNDATLVLGEDKYPAELENALIRRVVGDEIEISVTLPETFTALGLAGKAMIYKVKITSISTKMLPEYNDEFVKTVSAYTTVAEYEQYLYEKMKEELIFDKLLEKSTVKIYPTEEVQSYTSNFVKYYTEHADKLNITLEEYAQKKFFIGITEFHLKADAYAKELVKEELLLYRLARKYSIELSDGEYTSGAAKYVAEYGLKSVSELEGRFGKDYIRQTVLMDKMLAYLSEQIPVSEPPAV